MNRTATKDWQPNPNVIGYKPDGQAIYRQDSPANHECGNVQSPHIEMAISVVNRITEEFTIWQQNEFVGLIRKQLEERRSMEISRKTKEIAEIQESIQVL